MMRSSSSTSDVMKTPQQQRRLIEEALHKTEEALQEAREQGFLPDGCFSESVPA